MNGIRRGNQNHQNSLIGKIDEFDVPKAILRQTGRDDDADFIGKRGEKLRSFFHQTIRRVFVFADSQLTIDNLQIGIGKLQNAEQMIHEKAITFVGRNAPGGSVRLFEQAEIFEIAHHVSDRRRTDGELIGGNSRDYFRPDRLARDQMFIDNRRQNELPAPVGKRTLSFAFVGKIMN